LAALSQPGDTSADPVEPIDELAESLHPGMMSTFLAPNGSNGDSVDDHVNADAVN